MAHSVSKSTNLSSESTLKSNSGSGGGADLRPMVVRL